MIQFFKDLFDDTSRLCGCSLGVILAGALLFYLSNEMLPAKPSVLAKKVKISECIKQHIDAELDSNKIITNKKLSEITSTCEKEDKEKKILSSQKNYNDSQKKGDK